MIHSISIKNFTAFKDLNAKPGPGINVFLGGNSTGKSHLLKLMYALSAANKPIEKETDEDPNIYITRKLKGIFKPEGKIGRLCRNDKKAIIRIDFIPDQSIEFAFSGDMKEVVVTHNQSYEKYSWEPVFIPPKEMLSLFEGFSSLYQKRELTIDETYFDLCQALETPKLKGEHSKQVSSLLKQMDDICKGKFLLVKQKRFYYKPADGKMLEVEIVAEGFRKLGILHRLIENGHILPGVSGPLFWDEPESNLNPTLMKHMMTIL
ncbi:MAG: AAA family ATPase, partial [Desulfamplus sp.]|nr:AAA family ATPase [Desulfamplus sp.]